MEIRARLKTTNARCVFSEPQFESRLVGTIIEGTGVKTAILDPLGSDIAAGPDAYFELMRRLADNLLTGLE
jgi:zinc transport system substrate-binding protein